MTGYKSKRAMAQELLELAQEGMSMHSHDAPEYIVCEALIEALAQPAQEPVSLRRGDILRCIETDELCTVWATSTTSKTLIKWSANSFSDYTAAQIGELFWLEPKPAQEPVAWTLLLVGEHNGIVGKAGYAFENHPEHYKRVDVYTTPPQRTWVGLTNDERYDCVHSGAEDSWDVALLIEAKLKDKNNG